MKLAFSKPKHSSSSSKSKPSNTFAAAADSSAQIQPEFVSEFDPSKTLASAATKPIVIPPKENEWRPFKKMKNLDLPPLSSGKKPLDFELDDSDVGAANDSGSAVTYGLNLRQSTGNVHDSASVIRSGSGNNSSSVSSIETIMMRQFKSDLDRLPEQQGFDEYDDTPVDGFGAALLAGYGWKEGRGIGKNAKEDVKIVEYKRKDAKEGLGFFSDYRPAAKAGGDDQGNNERFRVGNVVRVVGGSNMGLKGTVFEVMGAGMVVLDTDAGRRTTIRVDDIAELGSVEEEKCLRKLKELEIRDSRDDGRKSKDDKSVVKESKRSREDGGVGVKHERVVQREERSNSNSKRTSWLTSHIRVRVISKEFKGGRFYLKKGEVMDVIGPGVCDLSMDDGGKIVQGVDQDILETALPKRGGPVLVLLGRHKGVYGKLVEKDSEKETGVVQDADSQEMFQVRLEQIAEYLGDPSYLGY